MQLKNSDSNLQNLINENIKRKKEEEIKENIYKENLLNNKNQIDKLKEDLNNQMKINEKMKEEIEKFKNEINNNIVNPSKEINNITNNENELKNEIKKLKNNLKEKEEKIKKLEEKNAEKEKDKGEDINFYKKSYEEQKIRVNEEHKLISESLYKLAIHFMTLKDDLQKRMNSSSSDK